MAETYDAVLVLSFGGPEGMDQVLPFLQNVLRGRNVPEERMREVAHHYEVFGGVSPINAHNRALVHALKEELDARGPRLPVYWGNRNWHPLLADTLRAMARDGVRRALAFVTSAYSSYSGCRQYLEDIDRARAQAGAEAPVVDKLRVYYNHPEFIGANASRVATALQSVVETRRHHAHVAFTAHSVPMAMARASRYEAQLHEACGLVAQQLSLSAWSLAWQSRSGPPTQPWLEPDVQDHLRDLRDRGVTDVVVAPIGFVSDHMEVVYDLDVEAQQTARSMGLNMLRARTAGSHPAFITMIRELILERTEDTPGRFLGQQGPRPDTCDPDCCRF